jgi:hypothetical protein
MPDDEEVGEQSMRYKAEPLVNRKGEPDMRDTTKGSGRGIFGARQWYAVLAGVIILSLLGGCAKFSASRKMDPGPFGENVTVMMGDVSADVRKPFYIKKYIEGPSRDEYAAEWANMKKSMRGIVLYSSQVVNIAQSPMTERKKPNALAATLREVTSGVPDHRLADIRITREELNDLIRNVEVQDTMLAALGQAQPLVDRIANYVDTSFERVEVALNKLIRDIDARMDDRWGLNRENVESLYGLQNLTFRSYALLYQYREGDAASLAALRANDPALQTALGKERAVGDKELDATEAQIMARLKNLNLIREQIMPQVERYLLEARERDELYNQHKEVGKKLRLTVMLWARAHRNLAAGIPVPPEIDLYNVLMGSVKKFSPVPLP